ncbi:MAG: phosphoribosylamine--glycine ligase [Polyangiales bacterium]
MRVLVVGSGGREHALASKLAGSPSVTRVVCAPGNGGTAAVADNVAVDPEDVAAVVELAKARAIDFVVVGPEAPLVAGLCDALAEAGILAFGPGKAGAALEGSKAYSKRFMLRHGVPTAAAEIFRDADAAIAYARAAGRPLVVKADGLAAGKGVIVAASVQETIDAIERLMRRRELGAAGDTVLLEECLLGEEVSFHVVIDGERFLPLAAAQDHKRLLDGDRGPNTGGMGAYSPPPVVSAEIESKILERVVRPTLAGLRADGIAYRGALFIGLMISDGEPFVIEYNTRFGDPETEVMLARYQGDLLPLLLGAARGDLRGVTVKWEAPAAMCVVLAADGYPGNYAKGRKITGLQAAAQVEGVDVLHAGTRREGHEIVTSGGRVLAVTARGASIDGAAERVYAAVDRIHFDGMQYRRDIGWRARRSS